MINLLIADDHAIVRSGIKQIFALTMDIRVAGEAINGAEVLDSLRQGTYDVLLLDLNMPGISGTDLISRVRSHYPDLPILVLSMHDQPQVVSSALKGGATGFATKDCEPQTLFTAVRQVARMQRYVTPVLAEKMALEAALGAPSLPHHLLSPRELEVLRLLAKGFGVNEIAEELAISNKTVSTHKMRLMEKMNFFSVADVVRYAMQHELLA
ncbi:response regulator transcription factor [Rhodoferax sp. GW822-FHT02A01]|uniref:response regulator transcription factor n=1 Tax=Rhodoferax sp. GW822-FHT02A01 TaxID=3141537 RepID=UPI00315DCA87